MHCRQLVPLSTSIVGTVPTETDSQCRNALDKALPTVFPMSTVGMVPTETDGRCRNALNNALPTVGTDVDFDCRYGTDRDRRSVSECT